MSRHTPPAEVAAIQSPSNGFDIDEGVPPPPPNAALSSFDDFGEPPPPPPAESDDVFQLVDDSTAPLPLLDTEPFTPSSNVAAAAVFARLPSATPSSARSSFIASETAAPTPTATAPTPTHPPPPIDAFSPLSSPISPASPHSAMHEEETTRTQRSVSIVGPPPGLSSGGAGSYSPSVSSTVGSLAMSPSSLCLSPAASATRTSCSFDDEYASSSSSGPAASSSASMLTAAQDLGSAKSFASSLSHSFPQVAAQVEMGSYAAKRAASFLKKLALAQEEFSRHVLKLVAHEQSKAAKLSADGMRLSTKSWLSFQDLMSRLAKSHLQEAAEVAQQVAGPLLDFHNQQEERRREILVEERKASMEMAKAREEVAKQLATTVKLLEDARKLQAEAKETAAKNAAAGGNASSGASGFFKTLARAVSKKPEELTKEAGKSAALYQTAILNANKRQTRYIESDMPKLFSDMQLLERRRIDTLKMRLAKFHATATSHSQERKGTMEAIKNTIEQMDASHDIATFIQDQLYEHGPPIVPRPFSYDLPCTPADIDAGRLEGNPLSIFRSTLQHCMELQRSSTDPAAARLDIPRILPALMGRIKELGGYTELGIFRISVGKEDLDALRKQIDADGNYNLSNVHNAHICAALLKEWVRLLVEPLIPTDPFYAQAIDAVRNSGNTSSAATSDAVMRIYDSLPPLNQRVLKAIGLMVRDLSKPENSDISKMTLQNLSLIWAACILRNPSDDPATLLSNSKYEVKFTVELFRLIGDITW